METFLAETEQSDNYWLITYYFKWMDLEGPATIANTVTTLSPADWLIEMWSKPQINRHYIYVINAISITKQQYDILDRKLPDM